MLYEANSPFSCWPLVNFLECINPRHNDFFAPTHENAGEKGMGVLYRGDAGYLSHAGSAHHSSLPQKWDAGSTVD